MVTCMLRLPEDLQLQLFLYLDYKSLSFLLCVHSQYKWLIDRDEVWSIAYSQHFFKSNNGMIGSQIKQKMHDSFLINAKQLKLTKNLEKIEQKLADNSRWVDDRNICNSSADINPITMVPFMSNAYNNSCSIISVFISTMWQEHKKNKYQKAIKKCQNAINDIHKSIQLK